MTKNAAMHHRMEQWKAHRKKCEEQGKEPMSWEDSKRWMMYLKAIMGENNAK